MMEVVEQDLQGTLKERSSGRLEKDPENISIDSVAIQASSDLYDPFDGM